MHRLGHCLIAAGTLAIGGACPMPRNCRASSITPARRIPPALIRIYNFVRLVRGSFSVADFNEDGHVDTADLSIFELCSSGPGVPYAGALTPDCNLAPDNDGYIAADFEPDGDVDQSDFALLQRCLSGAETKADPECS